jgi:hypothetical protein
MNSWKCYNLECADCGLQRYPSRCPLLLGNQERIKVNVWKNASRSGGQTQNEITEVFMTVEECMLSLYDTLKVFFPHHGRKIFSNRTRTIDIRTLPTDTLLVCTDFSAQVDLRANKTENCSVDGHAVLAIYYVFYNRQPHITQESGMTCSYCP